MNRYYFYLVILNMLVNVVAFVPNILFEQRYDGAISAMLLAVIIGTIFSSVLGTSLNRFPGEGMPEILDRYMVSWLRKGFLLYTGIMWFLAGILTILIFVDITKRFIQPELSEWMILSIYLLFVIFCAKMSTEKILYLLEMLIILNVPIVGLIFFKVYTHPYFSWDAVKAAGTYTFEIPSWNAFTAALYTVAGYLNTVIFHRVFKHKYLVKRSWMIAVLGLMNLFTTFFVPIGLQGFDGLGNFQYPWMSTADTLQFSLGPVERGIGYFLLLYVSISLISTVVHWHVGLALVTSAFSLQDYRRKIQLSFPWGVLIVFSIASFFIEILYDQSQIFSWSLFWYSVRFYSELFLIFLVFYLARRKMA